MTLDHISVIGIIDIQTRLVSESREDKTDVMTFDKTCDGISLTNFDPTSCEEVCVTVLYK